MKRRLRTCDEVMEYCKKNFKEMPVDESTLRKLVKELTDDIDKNYLRRTNERI